MASQISRIRSRIIALFCVVTATVLAVLMVVAPTVSGLASEVAKSPLGYLVLSLSWLSAAAFLLYQYLSPISDLGYALEIGSTPTPELVEKARRTALNVPIYLYVLPTVGVLVLSLIWDALRVFLGANSLFLEGLPLVLLASSGTLGGSVLISLVSRRWLRTALLYTSTRPHALGYRLNIRTRLLTVSLTLTLVALTFAGVLGYGQLIKALRAHRSEIISLRLEQTISSLAGGLPEGEVLVRVLEGLPSGLDYECVLLTGGQGRLVDQRPFECIDGATGESMLEQVASSSGTGSWLSEQPGRLLPFRMYGVWLPYDDWWIGIGYALRPGQSGLVPALMVTLGVFGAAVLALAALVSHYLGTDLSSMLDDVTVRLRDTVRDEGVNPSPPLPVLSEDEVGDLVLAFNALEQRIQDQREQIEHRQRQLAALQALSYKIGTTRDVDYLLQEVVRDVERALGYHNVSLLLVDETGETLSFVASCHPDAFLQKRKFRIGQDGVVGRVAAAGMPMLVNDVGRCDFYIADNTNTRSEMAVPIAVGERTIGVFNVSSERTGAFDDSDLQIVTALGNQIAIAIENARLFSEAVASAAELEQRARNLETLHSISAALGTSLRIEDVLNVAAERLVALFGVGHSTVILFGAEDREGRIAAEYPFSGGAGETVSLHDFPALRWVLNALEPLYIAEAQRSESVKPLRDWIVALGIESILIVPLLTKGRIKGAITLDVVGTRRTFSPEEIDVCQTAAAQVAVALENVQLIEDLRTQASMIARMARDVAAERSRLDAVLHHLADGLLVTDGMGRIVLFNPAFASLFNLDESGLEGQFVAKAVPQLPLQYVIQQVRVDSSPIGQEFSLLDGRFLHLTAASGAEEDGKQTVVILLRDVTEERQLGRMKSDFVSTVSHELRTPLTPVLGFAKLIRRSFESRIAPAVPVDDPHAQRAKERMSHDLGILVDGVERLSELVEDVLFVADLDAGRLKWQMAEVALDEIVRHEVDACRARAEAKGLELQVSLPERLSAAYGDAQRLARVIRHLLANAISFTESGQVCVYVQAIERLGGRWESLPFVEVPPYLPGSAYVLVAVRDTGPGISPEAQQTLFKRFHQGVRNTLTDKPPGTGLGLAISKEIVSYHGGQIWVVSEPGKGSTFAFVVPTLPLRVLRHLTVGGSQSVGRPPTILVVNGEPTVRDLLDRALADGGYLALFAADEQTAFNMARVNDPDLVLVDVAAPGIGGMDVATALKSSRTTKQIPIVMLSTLCEHDTARPLGVDACLPKPLDPAALLDTVAELLQERRALS